MSGRPDRSRDSRNETTSGGVSVRSSKISSWYCPPCRRVASFSVSAYRNMISDPFGNRSSYSFPFHDAPTACPYPNVVASSVSSDSLSSGYVRRNAPTRIPGKRTHSRIAWPTSATDFPPPELPPNSTSHSAASWKTCCFGVGA
jgi:hypothetical protein